MPGALKSLQDYTREVGGVDLVVFGYQPSPDYQWLLAERGPARIIEREVIRQKYLPAHLNIIPQDDCSLTYFVWNKMYNRSLLIDNGIRFEEARRNWEDGEFVINCLDRADKIAVLPEVLYNSFCTMPLDHLSSKLYPDQVLQYINAERSFKARLEDELDFSSARYIDNDFHTVCWFFEQMVPAFGREAVPFIQKAVNTDIVKYWADRYIPKDDTERRLKQCIADGDAYGIYHICQSSHSGRKY